MVDQFGKVSFFRALIKCMKFEKDRDSCILVWKENSQSLLDKTITADINLM